MSTQANSTQNKVVESISVKGKDLIETVKGIIAKGNVVRIIIYWANGDKLLEIPYVAGITVTALLALFVPIIAVFSPLAFLLGQFKLEIVRSEETNALREKGETE